jgi:hypothetical protein
MYSKRSNTKACQNTKSVFTDHAYAKIQAKYICDGQYNVLLQMDATAVKSLIFVKKILSMVH